MKTMEDDDDEHHAGKTPSRKYPSASSTSSRRRVPLNIKHEKKTKIAKVRKKGNIDNQAEEKAERERKKRRQY